MSSIYLYLSLSHSIYLPISLSIYLSLSVYIYIYLSVYLSYIYLLVVGWTLGPRHISSCRSHDVTITSIYVIRIPHSHFLGNAKTCAPSLVLFHRQSGTIVAIHFDFVFVQKLLATHRLFSLIQRHRADIHLILRPPRRKMARWGRPTHISRIPRPGQDSDGALGGGIFGLQGERLSLKNANICL